jgi:glycosyltransferase involved in cell wall biosynthesis
MKILVNASTLVVGGGIQIGVSFIQKALEESRFEWRFLVSQEIYLAFSSQIQSDERIVCIPISPAKLGSKSKKQILKIEEAWKPDIVYSIGFPSYIRFKQPEIGRYTNPWEINNKPLPWNLYPRWIERIKIKMGIWYRQYWARNAEFIETQTEAARLGISRRVRFPLTKIKVIPNSPNKIFLDAGKYKRESNKNDVSRIFCLAAPYPHKNLKIIPQVARILKDKFGSTPLFILTIPETNEQWMNIKREALRLGVETQIENLGKICLEQCLAFYNKSDIVFLPTLMEIFSATYLEAMAMGVPIVTTDLDFAHDNCGDAALYCSPNDASDAAKKIYTLLSDETLKNDLINKGMLKLQSYPENNKKYKLLFEWFEEIIKKNRT